MKIEPIVLEGDYVELEPLSIEHIPAFARFCFDQAIWQWFPYSIRDLEGLTFYINDAIKHKKMGTHLAFAIVDKPTGRVVGCTRFMNINAENLRTEIGSTWIDLEWQRTHVNTEAKILMLTHAFEVWKCVRVEFKTDSLNKASRSAILRLGATEEGTLRQHMVTESGRLRDSVYFSILNTEWDLKKNELVAKMCRYEDE